MLTVTRSFAPWFSALMTGCSTTKSGRSMSMAYSIKSNTGLQPLVSRRTYKMHPVSGQGSGATDGADRAHAYVGLEVWDDTGVAVHRLLVHGLEEELECLLEPCLWTRLRVAYAARPVAAPPNARCQRFVTQASGVQAATYSRAIVPALASAAGWRAVGT